MSKNKTRELILEFSITKKKWFVLNDGICKGIFSPKLITVQTNAYKLF